MTAVAMDPFAREAIKSLQGYRPGKPIEEVQRELGLKSVIKLASNENALGPSPKALKAIRDSARSLHRYPDATCAQLKQRLAARFKLDPSWFCLGNGSDELLVLALRAYVEPGDEVVVAEPTFLIYALQSAASGARVVAVPLKQFHYDLAAMRSAITQKTKVLFIANPDNPTGTYVTMRQLEAFLSGLPAHVLVVIDEAYYEFATAKDYPQTARWLSRGRILVTRTFSKAYGLAGLRVGYGLAQPPIIRALEAVREPFNVNSLAQAAACAALEDRSFLKRTGRMVDAGRRYLARELEALGLDVVPSAANFLLVRVGAGAPAIAGRLLREGIIVREMTAWKLDGFLRITVGTMAENRRCVRALRRVWNDVRPVATPGRPAAQGSRLKAGGKHLEPRA